MDSCLNLTYNSTLEGSVALVLCDRRDVTAFCHRNGSWSPHLTDSVCNFISTTMSSGEYHSAIESYHNDYCYVISCHSINRAVFADYKDFCDHKPYSSHICLQSSRHSIESMHALRMRTWSI